MAYKGNEISFINYIWSELLRTEEKLDAIISPHGLTDAEVTLRKHPHENCDMPMIHINAEYGETKFHVVRQSVRKWVVYAKTHVDTFGRPPYIRYGNSKPLTSKRMLEVLDAGAYWECRERLRKEDILEYPEFEV